MLQSELQKSRGGGEYVFFEAIFEIWICQKNKPQRFHFSTAHATPHQRQTAPTLPQHCATMTSSAVQAYPFLEPAKSSRGKCRVCEGQFVKGQPRLVLQIKNSVEGGWPPHILSYQHPACTLRACYFERRRKATHKLRCRVTSPSSRRTRCGSRYPNPTEGTGRITTSQSAPSLQR